MQKRGKIKVEKMKLMGKNTVLRIDDICSNMVVTQSLSFSLYFSSSLSLFLPLLCFSSFSLIPKRFSLVSKFTLSISFLLFQSRSRSSATIIIGCSLQFYLYGLSVCVFFNRITRTLTILNLVHTYFFISIFRFHRGTSIITILLIQTKIKSHCVEEKEYSKQWLKAVVLVNKFNEFYVFFVILFPLCSLHLIYDIHYYFSNFFH